MLDECLGLKQKEIFESQGKWGGNRKEWKRIQLNGINDGVYSSFVPKMCLWPSGKWTRLYGRLFVMSNTLFFTLEKFHFTWHVFEALLCAKTHSTRNCFPDEPFSRYMKELLLFSRVGFPHHFYPDLTG